MERKEFLKTLGLSAFVLPLIANCKEVQASASGDCDLTNPSTAGPFPTKNPESLQIVDITSDRKGVPFTLNLNLKDRSNNCLALAGAIVDIWHCDNNGSYSEYSGNTDLHFLRGRQVSNSNGVVTFQTIYPGWYPGRAPHIHLHVFDASGKSLLVSQIAFPESISNTVYTTSPLYSGRGTVDTSNSEDNIFNGTLDTTLADVTGSMANGYTLNHDIIVDA
jgi:protocatechuate 3,4-dioxygenase beta subunit